MSSKRAKSDERRRHAFAQRDGGWLCVYCGAPIECPKCNPATTIPATLDHILAKSRGGARSRSNLVLACYPCNQEKDARPLGAFLVALATRRTDVVDIPTKPVI